MLCCIYLFVSFSNARFLHDSQLVDCLGGFAGIVFVGGFSYADVLESAKGWAGTIRYNSGLWADFQDFYARPDTWCASFILCCCAQEQDSHAVHHL